jgi:predicted membrane-bound spermidine synthase
MSIIYLSSGAIFFASGFAALIYQITWQRSLFTIFGINVEAVTIVVAGFILGLGLGSLFGGWLSRTQRIRLLTLFGITEISIGAFGAISLHVFAWVGASTLGLPRAATAAVTVTVITLPTLLMGATLPILTQYLVEHERNVGQSVGLLYCVNTLGSATACFVSTFWLMQAMGMQNSVLFAAVINVLVGVSALCLDLSRGRPRIPLPIAREHASTVRNSVSHQRRPYFVLAVAVAILIGYVALSYEVLWFRAFLVGTNRAPAFALILGAYLAGLAFGSYWVRRYCTTFAVNSQLLYILCIVVLLSGILGFLVLPITAKISTEGMLEVFVPTMLLLVFAQTAIAGAVFPLLCHIGVAPDKRAGVRVGAVYASNIFGSVAGTLLTGFILMDYLSTAQISVFLTELSVIAAVAVAGLTQISWSHRLACITSALVIAVLSPYATNSFFDHYYERIIYKGEFGTSPEFSDIVENKSGVITVSTDGAVYGGGMYDGRLSVDLIDDKNFIIRPFSVALFHSHPREVLMIGLGTGAWAQVLANNPEIKRLTIVEINPGYLLLARKYAVVAPVLSNPKVEIIIDDGRRWMSRHPDRQFDLIVQNSSWYFRPNITNLLAVEYLRLAAKHLREGGVMMYNTNYSTRVMLTGCKIFSHGFRELNLVVVSNSPLRRDPERLQSALEHYQIDGRPVFDLSQSRHRRRLDEIMSVLNPPVSGQGGAHETIETCENIKARSPDLQLITDDNMGEEWR